MNTAVVKTQLGRTILVQLDETSPRPYSRANLIQGTEGTLTGFPTRVAGEKLGNGNYHEWIEGREKLAAIYEKYDHPLWKRIGELATKMGGHGGMDFVMLSRIVECLRNGEPMDQNVYEGASWSSLLPLTARSIAQGGMPVEFPDFTRGDWKNHHAAGRGFMNNAGDEGALPSSGEFRKESVLTQGAQQGLPENRLFNSSALMFMSHCSGPPENRSSAMRRLSLSMASMRSSMVPRQIRRCTSTFRCCPMR